MKKNRKRINLILESFFYFLLAPCKTKGQITTEGDGGGKIKAQKAQGRKNEIRAQTFS